MQRSSFFKTALLACTMTAATIAAPYITVKSISFNWDNTASAYDGINIRQDYSTPISVPEYTGPSSSSKAAYIKGKTPRIRVKFAVTPSTTTSLKIYGVSDDSNGVLGSTVSKTVTFTNGVSSDIEFSLNSSIPSKLYKSNEYWKWTIVQSSGNITCERTGPHLVYVVLGEASSPWSTTADDIANPWVSALDFAIDLSKGAMSGKSTINAATGAITNYLYGNHGLKYDTVSGVARYYTDGTMYLSKYMTKVLGPVVNCYDQAAAVVTFANLIGGNSFYVKLAPFGYLNPTYLTGISRSCNNPFYGKMTGTYANPLVGLDDSNRTKFGNHAIASLNNYAFDACSGPHIGSVIITSYYNNVVDKSTAAEAEYATALEEGYEANDISDIQ